MLKLYIILWISFASGYPCLELGTDTPEPVQNVEFTRSRDYAISHLANGHDVYQVRLWRLGNEPIIKKLRRRPAFEVNSSTVPLHGSKKSW